MPAHNNLCQALLSYQNRSNFENVVWCKFEIALKGLHLKLGPERRGIVVFLPL